MFSKMKFKYLGVFAVGLLFQLNPLKAQETLTLQDAIKYALQNKADAKKSKLDVLDAQNKIDEARSAALPQISATGGATYNAKIQKQAVDVQAFGGFGGGEQAAPDGSAPQEGLMLLGFGTPWVSTNTVSLNQQIFNQTVFTGLKAAKTTREFYQLNDALTEEQMIEKVANAYYEVFQTKQNLETVQTNLDNTIKTRDIIKGLYEAGLQRKIDLDRLNVSVNNIESQKQQLVNSLELQENALKFVIGMNISRKIQLPEETFTIDLSNVYETVDLENRAEIRLLNKQSELLELNKKAIRAQYYPTVSLNANYGVMGFSNDFFLFKPKSSVWADFSTIGLNINIPIFNGHATRSKVRQAQIEIDRLNVDIIDTKLGLDLANQNAKAQIENNLLVIKSNEENIRMAKEVLDNTQNNYRNGLATLTDLLDAEKSYADAQNNYTTSLLNYKVAEIQLIKANGNLKTLINE